MGIGVRYSKATSLSEEGVRSSLLLLYLYDMAAKETKAQLVSG